MCPPAKKSVAVSTGPTTSGNTDVSGEGTTDRGDRVTFGSTGQAGVIPGRPRDNSSGSSPFGIFALRELLSIGSSGLKRPAASPYSDLLIKPQGYEGIGGRAINAAVPKNNGYPAIPRKG